MKCQKCDKESVVTYKCTCGCSITGICEECKDILIDFTKAFGIDSEKTLVRN